MVQEPSTKWELGRFLTTLTYFEAFPFLDCLQRFFKGEKKAATQQRDINKMGIFLVLGDVELCGKKVVNYLVENGYQSSLSSRTM